MPKFKRSTSSQSPAQRITGFVCDLTSGLSGILCFETVSLHALKAFFEQNGEPVFASTHFPAAPNASY